MPDGTRRESSLIFCPDALEPGSQDFNDGRKEGNEYDSDNQDLQILLHERLVTEKISGIAEYRHPGSPSDCIVRYEPGIMHPAHTRYKWSESPDYRHKPGNHYGLPSIFPIELMSLFKIALLEYP